MPHSNSPPTPARPAQTSRRNILFVDDEPDYLNVLQGTMALFSEGKWAVFAASSAGQALLLLQQESIDLIIVDLRLPVLDGIQFLQLVQRKYPDLVKIVLTGHADASSRAASLSNGADMFLEKPRSPEDLECLFATLDEILDWQTKGSSQTADAVPGMPKATLMSESIERSGSVCPAGSGALPVRRQPPGEQRSAAGNQPVIQEMLLGSNQAEVLYEWQCPDATQRLAFLQKLNTLGSALGRRLSLGALEQIEIQDRKQRVLFVLEGGYCLYTRRTPGMLSIR